MAKYVLAIDPGTTGSTALILDQRLSVKGKANVEFRQIFPKPGWVEHDPQEIWFSQIAVAVEALERPHRRVETHRQRRRRSPHDDTRWNDRQRTIYGRDGASAYTRSEMTSPYGRSSGSGPGTTTCTYSI